MLKKCSLIVALFIALTSCTQSSSSSDKPEYLFVILSNYGQVQQASDGSWQLILSFKDMANVLSFANRPFRIATDTTAMTLQDEWANGSNSFATDPPNAAIIVNQRIQTVVIKSLEAVQGQATFTIEADGHQSLYPVAGKTQLFLDGSMACVIPCACGC